MFDRPATAADTADRYVSEPPSLLEFPDEEALRAEKAAREAERRRETEAMLDRMSLELCERWDELQDDAGLSAAAAQLRADAGDRTAPAAGLQAVVRTVPDAILSFDADGAIRSFNAGAERLFGYSAAEITGSLVQELIPIPLAADADPAQPWLARIEDAGERGIRESLAYRKDGETRIVEVSIGAVTIDGESLGAAVVRDITGRKRVEREMQRLNQSLQAQVEETQRALAQLRETQGKLVQAEKLASLGGLVAGVAHEINTPVGTALTAASHLAEQMETLASAIENGTLKRSQLLESGRAGNQSARLIVSNLNRAAQLVQSFKQVAVDRESSDWRRIDLGAYLDEVLLSLSPRLRNTGLRLDTDFEPGLEIETAPGALSQVIDNLFMNALTHGFAGRQQGLIRVGARRVDGAVEVSFSDDGCGIADENLPRIFDPFYTTRRGSGGSGLGLHIVHNLVHQTLRGTIEVQSREGEGARFLLRL